MFPEADVPVIQLSIDRNIAVRGHFEIARHLTDLRDQGVLILTSGNAVHNLADAFARMRIGLPQTLDWARRFDAQVKDILTQRDTDALVSLWPDLGEARRVHLTPDHWLPLIYACGATDCDDEVRFPNEGFDWGSFSMRNAVFG